MDNKHFQARVKSLSCINCHDAEAQNQEHRVPILAGQISSYLLKLINLFGNRTRIHPVLSTHESSMNFSPQVFGLI